MESRFEKFAELRAEINKQIKLDHEFGEINNVINEYMLRLNEIDSDYFSEVRSNFEQEFNWEKLFFDRNMENQSYNPAFKKELEKLSQDMQFNIPDLSKDYSNKEKLSGDRLITNFLLANNEVNKYTFQEIQIILDELLVKKIEYQEKHLNLINDHKNYQVTSLDMTLKEINTMRQQDKRSVETMTKNVTITFEEKQNNFLQTYQKFYNNKKLLVALMLIGIMLLLGVVACAVIFFVI